MKPLSLFPTTMKTAAKWLRMLLVLLLGGASAVAVAENGGWKLSTFLVDSFVEIALRNANSTRRNPVRKWSGPVNYFIVQRVGDEDMHRKMIHLHFEHLAGITGLPIRPAASQNTANFLVVLTSEDRLEAELAHHFGAGSVRLREDLLRHSLCIATFATERKGAIARAVIVIPVDRARGRGSLASCMVEELTHAMGLPNDSITDIPSIFSRKSGLAYLSGLDYLMLKMLYDPRVKAGMSEKTVLPVLQVIAEEYEREKRFETAERIAAEGGLSGLSP